MSNGYQGCGSVNAEFRYGDEDHKGVVGVQQCWSSGGNWVELGFRPADWTGRMATVYLDGDNGDAVEFAAAVLRAVGEDELAEGLLAKSKVHLERQAARERVLEAGHAAKKRATTKLLAATADARAEFDATMAAVEAEYQDVVGERMSYSRSVSWDESSF